MSHAFLTRYRNFGSEGWFEASPVRCRHGRTVTYARRFRVIVSLPRAGTSVSAKTIRALGVRFEPDFFASLKREHRGSSIKSTILRVHAVPRLTFHDAFLSVQETGCENEIDRLLQESVYHVRVRLGTHKKVRTLTERTCACVCVCV